MDPTNIKIAVLSHSLPPSPTGQAIMLYRLLSEIDSENYCLISKEYYPVVENKQKLNQRLPAKYYWIGFDKVSRESRYCIFRLVQNGHQSFRTIMGRINSVCTILRKEKSKVLIACTGTILDILIGFVASKVVGIKFVAYIIDDYVYKWKSRHRRKVVGLFTSYILRNSLVTIVPNEFLQEEYKTRYGISPVVIHNPVEVGFFRY